MNFSEFAQTLYPYIGKRAPKTEYIKSLFSSILSTEKQDELDDACASKNTSNEIYAALNKSNESYKKFYSGKRRITRIARAIHPYTDPENFENIIDDISHDRLSALCSDFKNEIPDIDNTNAGIKIGELFIKILKEETAETRKKKVPPRTQETNITSDEIIPMVENLMSNELTPMVADIISDRLTSMEADFLSKIVVSSTFPKDPYINFSIEDLKKSLNFNDLKLLEEFMTDYDPILEECMKTQYTVTVNIDLPDKIYYLYEDRWNFKSLKFENRELQNFVNEITNTLDELYEYISDAYMRVCYGATYDTLIPRKTHRDKGFEVHDILLKETGRIKTHIRILYIALHPSAKNAPVFADLRYLFDGA